MADHPSSAELGAGADLAKKLMEKIYLTDGVFNSLNQDRDRLFAALEQFSKDVGTLDHLSPKLDTMLKDLSIKMDILSRRIESGVTYQARHTVLLFSVVVLALLLAVFALILAIVDALALLRIGAW